MLKLAKQIVAPKTKAQRKHNLNTLLVSRK